MSGKNEPASGSIVTSDQVHDDRGHKVVAIAGAALLVVLLGAAGWYAVGHDTFIASIIGKKSSQSGSKQATLTPAQRIGRAQAQLQQASTPQEKSAAYTALGRAYIDNNQPDQAIVADQAAMQSDPGDKALALGELAGAYLNNHQTQQAIDTMNQLVPILQASSDPNDHNLAIRYQNFIQQLEEYGQ